MSKSRRVICKALKSKKKRRQQRRKEVSLISFNVEPQDSYQMNVQQNSPKRNSNNVSTLYFLGKTFQRYLPALKNEILSSFMRPFSLFQLYSSNFEHMLICTLTFDDAVQKKPLFTPTHYLTDSSTKWESGDLGIFIEIIPMLQKDQKIAEFTFEEFKAFK